jgi:uncharacterized alkaline shock family protein YloU
MTVDGAPERTVLEVRAAEAAADAARAVPGVAALQPGLWGLVRRLTAESFERLTGRPVPDTAGVEADLRDGGLRLDLRIVLDGGYQAAAVAAGVQRAVGAAVPAAVGQPVVGVAVHVVAISLE